MTTGGDPRWRNEQIRDQHFRKHRRKLGLRTIAEYERSTLETIHDGIRFEYFDSQPNKWRIGYYDPPTGRFTALSNDALEIETHFRCSESYVQSLVSSTYPW